MKGWRYVLTVTVLSIVGAALFLSLLILAQRFRQWMLYDEVRVQAQIERRVRSLEERIEKLEHR